MSQLTFQAGVTKRINDNRDPDEPFVHVDPPEDYAKMWWKRIEPFLINYTDVYVNKTPAVFIDGIGDEPTNFNLIKKKKDIETLALAWLKCMAQVLIDECPDPSLILNNRRSCHIGLVFTCTFTQSGGGAKVELKDERCKSPSWFSITFKKR